MNELTATAATKPYNLSKKQVRLIVRGLYSLRSKISNQPGDLAELTKINNLLLDADEVSAGSGTAGA